MRARRMRAARLIGLSGAARLGAALELQLGNGPARTAHRVPTNTMMDIVVIDAPVVLW